ncbi:MAG: iron-containing redox enzyme family protein [Pseudomonadota bacterium]
MNKWHDIKQEFELALADFMQCETMRRMQEGSIELAHYQAILRQIFHHTRENPQIQALATVYFRGAQRDIIKRFYAHASSEIGHDQLALNDLAVTGADVAGIPEEYPLPATSALLAFAFYQIRDHNPVGYLGYLMFLEFTPTTVGGELLAKLASLGVPDEATTFLQDHTTIDVGHNKLMEIYVDKLVQTEADIEAVKYGLHATGRLYAAMLDDAIEQADRAYQPQVNHAERLVAA